MKCRTCLLSVAAITMLVFHVDSRAMKTNGLLIPKDLLVPVGVTGSFFFSKYICGKFCQKDDGQKLMNVVKNSLSDVRDSVQPKELHLQKFGQILQQMHGNGEGSLYERVEQCEQEIKKLKTQCENNPVIDALNFVYSSEEKKGEFNSSFESLNKFVNSILENGKVIKKFSKKFDNFNRRIKVRKKGIISLSKKLKTSNKKLAELESRIKKLEQFNEDDYDSLEDESDGSGEENNQNKNGA